MIVRRNNPRNLDLKKSFTKLKYGPSYVLHSTWFTLIREYKLVSWPELRLQVNGDAVWTRQEQVHLVQVVKPVKYKTLSKLGSYQKSFPVSTIHSRGVSATAPAHSPSSHSETQKWGILSGGKKASLFNLFHLLSSMSWLGPTHVITEMAFKEPTGHF